MKSISRSGELVLLAVAFLTIMVGCVIVPGLPRISEALGVPELASWLVTLPSLGVVLCGPLVARLLGKIGLYNGLRLGLLLYGALGAGGALLEGAWLIVADRVLLGGATALVMAAGTGLISEFYCGSQRLSMIAKQGMAIELGGVIFLSVGGLLAVAGWRYPFLLYLFAWLLWACVEMVVPRRTPQVQPAGETVPAVRISGTLWLVYVAAALSMVTFFCAVISLPRNLQGLGLSEAQIGYFLSFVSLMAVAAAALMPRAVSAFGELGVLVGAFVCYAIAHSLFFFGDGLELYVLGGIALGCGFGFSMPLVNHMTVERSHERERGRMLAYLSMAIFLGQFLSSLLELLPGEGKTVFVGAVVMSGAGAILLPAWHQNLRRVRVHQGHNQG